MTVREAFHVGVQTLKASPAYDTPVLDATVLLGFVLGKTKEQLFASFPQGLSQEEFNVYRELLERRKQGVPVSYLRRVKEFYGLDFYVDERVLVPRPATETLIRAVCAILDEDPRTGLKYKLHDLCTGSGCIPITLQKLLPDLIVSASDISLQAAEVFAINLRNHLTQTILFVLSDLFAKLIGEFDIITANPPYLTEEQVGKMRARNWPEPELSLNGGTSGLDLLNRIIRECGPFMRSGGWLILEADPEQMPELKLRLKTCGFEEPRIFCETGGYQRVIAGRWMI